MKVIRKTIYIAEDGTEFTNKAKCKKHEVFCQRLDNIMSILPPLPKDPSRDFANGHGFIQHDPSILNSVRLKLLDEIERIYGTHQWIDKARAGVEMHPSYICRLIEDTPAALARAWDRICCVDKEYREWGQAYFALNPDKGEQVRLNRK